MAGNLEKLSKGMANFSTLLSLHKKIDQIFEFIKRIFGRFFYKLGVRSLILYFKIVFNEFLLILHQRFNKYQK